MRKNGSSYNKEFKSDAVKLVVEEGYSAAEAARNLGISKRTLRDWIKKSQRDVASGEREQEKDLELKRLQEEVRRLRMEREILKKAAAFFAKENH